MKLPKFLYNLVINHKTSLGDNKAFPPEDDYPFDYKILKTRFNEVLEKMNEYPRLQKYNNKELGNLLSTLIYKCQKIEEPIQSQLTNLCENIVNENLQVPQDTLITDYKLVKEIKPMKGFRVMPENSNETEYSFEDLDDINNSNDAVLKRRLINSLIQGAAYECGLLYKSYTDEINELNPHLLTLYDYIIVINDYLLFTKDCKISDKKPMQGSCVEVILGNNGNKSEIHSQGIIFPLLLSETFRGMFELFASHGLPKDKEKLEYIINHADFLLAEPWDLRMGVKLWKFIGNDVENNLLPYYFSSLCSLPIEEFNSVMQEFFAHTKKSQYIKNKLLNDADKNQRMISFIGTINKKNNDNNILADSYLSANDLDSFIIDDENNNEIISEKK